jgi:hypothetical protein
MLTFKQSALFFRCERYRFSVDAMCLKGSLHLGLARGIGGVVAMSGARLLSYTPACCRKRHLAATYFMSVRLCGVKRGCV